MEEVKTERPARFSKQVIVMRKDIKCRRGKEIAQGAHSSVKAILDLMYESSTPEGGLEKHLVIKKGSAIEDWICGKFTKICVTVDSLEELHYIYEKAKSAGLPCALITDAGFTEFNGVPTVTCCAIGPAWNEDVDIITHNLKLY